jgi:hypothetical protein
MLDGMLEDVRSKLLQMLITCSQLRKDRRLFARDDSQTILAKHDVPWPAAAVPPVSHPHLLRSLRHGLRRLFKERETNVVRI